MSDLPASLIEAPDARWEAFLASLVSWSETGRVVIAMRADRLTDVSSHPGFARMLERSLYLLGAMTETGLRAAVEAPARLGCSSSLAWSTCSSGRWRAPPARCRCSPTH